MSEGDQTMGEPVFHVVEPAGPPRPAQLQPVPGVADIAGARIGFVWDLLFKGDLVFDAIAAELEQRHPGVEFVGYQAFGDIHGPEEARVLSELPELLRQERVDAVVAGVGA